MTLRQLSTLAIVVQLTLLGLLLSRIIVTELRALNATANGQAAIRVANMALVAAANISTERGTANGLLGDGDQGDPVMQRRLARARAQTDAALRDVAAAVAHAPQTPRTRFAADMLRRAQTRLIAGRAAIDLVAALPRKARRAPLVMGSVDAMSEAVPLAMNAETALSRDAEEVYPQVADELVAARLAGDLREHAGRLGSEFTFALINGKPLSPAERQGVWTTRGRIVELRDLIDARLVASQGDPRVTAAARRMNEAYFGRDLRFLDRVVSAGDGHRPYGFDTAQFAARYVPPIASIVALRDALVRSASDDAANAHAAAVRATIVLSIVGALTFVTVCGVLLVLRVRVIRPLLMTARVVTDIARGRLATVVPAASRHDEIGDVLDAVEALRRTSAEKAALEEDRQRLIDELRLASTTDYLTGLMNRRAFVQTAEQQLANARRYGWPLALIIFDIDHFKSVNDTFGHEAGDIVITSVAGLAKTGFRAGDVVSRYGGEEFATLAPHCTREDALVLTERVRVAIAGMPFALPDGRTVSVTASFGVVAAPAGATVELAALVRAADEALYRAKEDGRNRIVLRSLDDPSVASDR